MFTIISYENDATDQVARHWSPESEKFGSGDALLHALDSGWHIDGVIFRQEFWHRGGRRVPVYHFHLHRADSAVQMAVVENPRVARLVSESGAQVVLLNLRKGERW